MSRPSFVYSILLVCLATGSALAQGPTSVPPPSKPLPSIEQMNAHVQNMQALHERMQKSTTAEERRKLMDEHRHAMKEGMAMMAPMMGSSPGGHGMMGGGGHGMMGGGGSGTMRGSGQGSTAHPAPAEPSMELMHRRIDMMQMTMQMMMDQQGMMDPSGTPSVK
jgi:hypothetical protein